MYRLIKKLAILPIRIYQWIISPLLGSNCRHEPTCSQFAMEAVEEWGVFRGFWMGLKRILSCHPWGKSGYHPVPKKGMQAKKTKKNS